jgi:hypothetical protein
MEEEQATARATADPYGMTNKSTGNNNNSDNDNDNDNVNVKGNFG